MPSLPYSPREEATHRKNGGDQGGEREWTGQSHDNGCNGTLLDAGDPDSAAFATPAAKGLLLPGERLKLSEDSKRLQEEVVASCGVDALLLGQIEAMLSSQETRIVSAVIRGLEELLQSGEGASCQMLAVPSDIDTDEVVLDPKPAADPEEPRASSKPKSAKASIVRKSSVIPRERSKFTVVRFAQAVSQHPKFDMLVSAVIIACALAIAWETHWRMTNLDVENVPIVFRVIDLIFNGTFLLELAIRLLADQLYFFSCGNPSTFWNYMDACLVASSLIDEIINAVSNGGVNLAVVRLIRVLRLTRVFRLVRVLRFFTELRMMVNGIATSARSVFWAIILLALVMFMFGVCIMQLVTPQLVESGGPELLLTWYGSLPRTLLTLFQSISGGMDWKEASDPLFETSPAIGVLFLAYVFFTMFCALNIVTGIFLDNATKLKDKDEQEVLHEVLKEQEEHLMKLDNLFSKFDSKQNGLLDQAAFMEHIKQPLVMALFHSLGIDPKVMPADELFGLFDVDDTGTITIDDFCDALQNLRGNARSLDLHRMRKEGRAMSRQVNGMSGVLKRMANTRGLRQL